MGGGEWYICMRGTMGGGEWYICMRGTSECTLTGNGSEYTLNIHNAF